MQQISCPKTGPTPEHADPVHSEQPTKHVPVHKSNDRLLRLPQVVGPKGLLPFSRSTFYDKIKQGELPEPLKLGPRIACWRKSDILAFVAKMEAGNE